MIVLKCPVCGKPLPSPVRKGGRPRQYCSKKCAQKVANKNRKDRGYRRPKNHRHVCVVCGETFYSERTDSKCCSTYCGNTYAALMKTYGGSVKLKLRKKALAIQEEREAKRRQLEACRETAPITVDCVRTTDGRTLVVETRGQRCIGFRAVSFAALGRIK